MKDFISRASLILASGFGTGFFPWASGTFASLAYIPIYLALYWILPSGIAAQLYLLLALCVLGWLSTHFCLKEKMHEIFNRQKLSVRDTKDQDPSFVVIDEWAGMQTTLLVLSSFSWIGLILAFIYFRIFDILKPKPVSTLEELPGALGVMADDVMAGIYAAIALKASLILLTLTGLDIF
jgi:phosphatidylglycerophosphatase A